MNVTILALHVFVTAGLAGAAALLLERTLVHAGRPTRWIWLGALALSAWLGLSPVVAPAPAPTPRQLAPYELDAGPLPNSPGIGPAAIAAANDDLRSPRIQVAARLASAISRIPAVVVPRGWILGGWAATSLLITMVLLAATLQMHRRARRWRSTRVGGRMVRISSAEGPATAGVLHPEIVVPQWMASMPADELELVLRHEEEHVRAGDTRLLALALLACTLIPWNPLTWWQWRRLRHAVEVDCDRRVLRSGAHASRYGELLLRIGLQARTPAIPAPALAGSRSSLERRLTAMKNAHTRIRPLPLAGAIVGSFVLIMLACSGDLPIASPQAEGSAPVAAPESSKAELEFNGDRVILLEVDAEGILRMDGEVQEISTLAEALEPIATNETVVKVQVHPGTTYRAVSDITDQVRMVGLLRVIFAQEAVEEVYPFVLPSYPQPEQGEPAPPGGFVREINEETLRSRAPSVPAWNLLNLTVLPEGVVRVRRADDPGGAQLMTTQQITQMLATQHAANPNTIAVLLAGAETPYRFVYEVLGAIQESPVNRYSIQVEERGKEEQGARSQDQGG